MSSTAAAPAAAAAAAPRETRHAMKLRHKAELKALLAAPAKGIGAKKAQKDAATKLEAEQAQQLAELEQREKAEKEAEESADADEGAQQTAADGDDEEDPISSHAASPPTAAAASSQGKQPSRAQQKKAKAAQKDAARMAQLRAETSGMRDVRGEENAAIASLLSKHTATAAANGSAPPRRLRVKEMVSDGHCLYRALADQAAAHHLTRSLPLNDNVSPFMSLRQLCAHYMRTHRDDFAAFMLTDEGDMIDDAGWTAYLRTLESEQAAVWGGHTEIVALSKAMRRPIVVWSAEGKMEVGEEFKQDGSEAAAAAGVVAAAPASAVSPSAASPSSPSPDAGPLHISFHRHYFGLGNHYNSVVPVDEEDEEDEEGNEQQAGEPQEAVAAVTQGVAAL
jgi:OTU domain-containing protein 6